jgi:hypothetical protein
MLPVAVAAGLAAGDVSAAAVAVAGPWALLPGVDFVELDTLALLVDFEAA